MARKGISKQRIFKAAQEIAIRGELPTAIKVRSTLATGSITTIQKYLQEWKIDCFKNTILHKELNIDTYNNDELAEKNCILEQTLRKQITQNEHYAQELINAEKTNIALKEEVHQLQTTIQELQLKLNKAETINNTLEQVNQKIQNRLDANDNETIKKMQQIIDGLMAELKTLNETSLTAVRETSTNGHEILMQEKVTSINLQAKIDNLYKDLIESKNQLNVALLKSQVQTQPLLRQIEWQQKIIQEHVEVEKLRQLEEKSKLNFNSQVEVGYGK